MSADAAAIFLLEKVTEVISDYSSLISGADEEFQQLEKDVRLLKANLQNLSNMSTNDHSVEEIRDQVLQVIYMVEDTIDLWLTEAAKLEGRGQVIKCFSKWLNPYHTSLASKVRSLRHESVNPMLVKTETKGPAPAEGTSKKEHVREGTNTKDNPISLEKVVGFQDVERNIIGCLKTPQEKLDIISIIGLPGLGKTTMAWKIFNDESISTEFPIRIWVHFSQRFNFQNVLLKITSHFTKGNNDVSDKSDRELCDTVLKCLKGEKFLLVFDDVWETGHWDDIEKALPSNNGISKVMITSRHENVGRRVTSITPPYKHKPLSEKESWELLQYRVFGDLKSCPDELQAFGERIAHKKCKGVPLIILLMGVVLKDHYLECEKSLVLTKKKWKEVSENDNLALEDQYKKVILDVVAMSYYSLPEHLRDCFLYLGVFPEGYEIPSWTLTSLWIAEGFVKPREDESLEKTAEKNLNELINRNLLMAHKRNSMLEVKLCGVHDMIGMFCRNEAKAQKLFQEKMLENQVPSKSEMDMIRRLCLHSDLQKFFKSNIRGQHVRSFLSFRKKVINLDPKYNAVISKGFTKLRILQSKYIQFKKFPKSVTKLIHLRYIVLCVDNLEELPETISQLWNLQTIIIDTNSNSIKMKANIWKMSRLRHVKTKAAIFLDGKWEGAAGENLQILKRLSPESVTGDFSGKASKLKTLGIRGILESRFDSMSLDTLSNLENLKLYHLNGNPLQHFPGKGCFPQNLKKLTLSNTSLGWEHMSTIASIGVLEVLKLKDDAFKGASWKANDYSFDNLQFLLIADSDLLRWEVSATAFPCLTHLVLKNCTNLYKVPVFKLKKLKNLEIEKVRKSLADSLGEWSLQLKLTVGAGCEI